MFFGLELQRQRPYLRYFRKILNNVSYVNVSLAKTLQLPEHYLAQKTVFIIQGIITLFIVF